MASVNMPDMPRNSSYPGTSYRTAVSMALAASQRHPECTGRQRAAARYISILPPFPSWLKGALSPVKPPRRAWQTVQ
jgi:hypothetical protein